MVEIPEMVRGEGRTFMEVGWIQMKVGGWICWQEAQKLRYCIF